MLEIIILGLCSTIIVEAAGELCKQRGYCM